MLLTEVGSLCCQQRSGHVSVRKFQYLFNIGTRQGNCLDEARINLEFLCLRSARTFRRRLIESQTCKNFMHIPEFSRTAVSRTPSPRPVFRYFLRRQELIITSFRMYSKKWSAIVALPFVVISTVYGASTGLSVDPYKYYSGFPAQVTCPVAGSYTADAKLLKQTVHDNLEYATCDKKTCSLDWYIFSGTNPVVIDFEKFVDKTTKDVHIIFQEAWVDNGVCTQVV